MAEAARRAETGERAPFAQVVDFQSHDALRSRLAAIEAALMSEGRRMEPDRLRQKELRGEVARLQSRLAQLVGELPPHTD
jgi:hypothetical protein